MEHLLDPVSGRRDTARFSDGSRVVRRFSDGSENRRLLRVEVYAPSAQGGALRWWEDRGYDDLTGELTSTATPEGRVDYAYDAHGRRTRVATSRGAVTEYTYNALGTLDRVRQRGPGTGPEVETGVGYEYEPTTGRKRRATASNGAVTEWTYDPRDRVATVRHLDAAGGELHFEQYVRDGRGLITAREERYAQESVPRLWNCLYDVQTRLTTATMTQTVAGGAAVTGHVWTYDLSGNRISESVTETLPGQPPEIRTTSSDYNSLDQLVLEAPSVGTARGFRYDLYGNLTEIRDGDNVSSHCTWSADDRLTRVTVFDESGVERHSVNYSYGGGDELTGRRVTKPALGGGTVVEADDRYLVGSDGHPLAEYSELGQGGSGRDWLRGVEAAPLGSVATSAAAPAGVFTRYHGDAQGSVKALSGPAGQLATGSQVRYNPFGKPETGAAATASTFEPRYTGKMADAQAGGIQHHAARWLDPAQGRWLSQDPVFDFPENFGHPYTYVGNNPLTKTDPSGRFSLVEAASVMTIMADLAGMQMYGGIQILQNNSAEGANWASLIIRSLREGILDIASYVPVIFWLTTLYDFVRIAGVVLETLGAMAGLEGDATEKMFSFVTTGGALFEDLLDNNPRRGMISVLRASNNAITVPLVRALRHSVRGAPGKMIALNYVHGHKMKKRLKQPGRFDVHHMVPSWMVLYHCNQSRTNALTPQSRYMCDLVIPCVLWRKAVHDDFHIKWIRNYYTLKEGRPGKAGSYGLGKMQAALVGSYLNVGYAYLSPLSTHLLNLWF